jgi:hypothetical protein
MRRVPSGALVDVKSRAMNLSRKIEYSLYFG